MCRNIFLFSKAKQNHTHSYISTCLRKCGSQKAWGYTICLVQKLLMLKVQTFNNRPITYNIPSTQTYFKAKPVWLYFNSHQASMVDILCESQSDISKKLYFLFSDTPLNLIDKEKAAMYCSKVSLEEEIRFKIKTNTRWW